MQILNNCEIRYTIARYKWFDMTGNVHIRHQQALYKGDEQTVESDVYVRVSSTKKVGWGRFQISLHGKKKVTKYGSDLREVIMMDCVTTINTFGNPNMITNRQNQRCQ